MFIDTPVTLMFQAGGAEVPNQQRRTFYTSSTGSSNQRHPMFKPAAPEVQTDGAAYVTRPLQFHDGGRFSSRSAGGSSRSSMKHRLRISADFATTPGAYCTS
ncbi:MAG: hypothetical protein SGJ27_09505 [Candidatus Melainabacteria bacterium]|nr:hypothetical protein [Candidatus Melainabacteria bacterium]